MSRNKREAPESDDDLGHDNPMLSAIVYAARGWHVLPLHGVTEVDGGVECTCAAGESCRMPGAHILDGWTLADAVAASTTIASWWKQHPYANVGIVAGSRSGLAVVVVDEDLLDARLQPVAERLASQSGAVIRCTGRSTLQMLFRLTPDLDDGDEIARGLVYQTAAALVVAPPSRLVIGVVEWEGGRAGPLSDLPASLDELVKVSSDIGVPGNLSPAPAPPGPALLASRSAGDSIVVEPVLVPFTAIESAPVEWLVENYVPLNELTILGGHPGAGKSVFASDLVACVSRGAEAPITGQPIPRGGVIIMGREEDPARAIRPRLEAAGADMERVFVLNDVREPGGGERSLRLPRDVDAIGRACRAHDVRLIVIDPITDFLHRVDANSEQDVRHALLPLVQLARKERLAVVFVRHLTKREHANLLHGGLGSVAFGAVARAGVVIERAGDHRVLRATKSSLCPEGVPPIAFDIVSAAPHGVGRVQWRGPVSEPAAPSPLTALDRAKQFLVEQLASGPVLAKDMLARATAAGVAHRNLRAAKTELGVRSAGRPSRWLPPVREEGCNAATPYGDRSVAEFEDDAAEDE